MPGTTRGAVAAISERSGNSYELVDRYGSRLSRGRSYCFLLSSASSFERSSHRPFVGRKCCSQGRVLDPWPLTYAEEVTARTSRPVSKSRVEGTPSVSRG